MQEGKHSEHKWYELEGISNLYEAPLPEEKENTFDEISNFYEAPLPEETEISALEDKRWSLGDEMSKLFDASLNLCFPEFEEDADLFPSHNKEHGDYNCQNVLTIWPKLRKSLDDHSRIRRPRDVGKAIKRNLPESAIDVIEGRPSVFDVGFVTFSLSPKWMAERIHKMLKEGINTWAPKLPVETVLVKYPSLVEKILMGQHRRNAIAETLLRMLKYSKVDATMSSTYENYPKVDATMSSTYGNYSMLDRKF